MGWNLMIIFVLMIFFKICYYFLKLWVNFILVIKVSRFKIEL